MTAGPDLIRQSSVPMGSGRRSRPEVLGRRLRLIVEWRGTMHMIKWLDTGVPAALEEAANS